MLLSGIAVDKLARSHLQIALLRNRSPTPMGLAPRAAVNVGGLAGIVGAIATQPT